MTIPLDNYTPALAAKNADRSYGFTFPYSDAGDIEVYEIYSTGARFQVPPQDYVLENRTNPREPTKEGGTITITRVHPDTVEEVSIERNTLITQLADFSKDSDFNTRMLEYVLDKATMILQEINERKCDSAPSTAITQLLVFGSYFAIPADRINAALDKLYDIALQIDGSAEDCRGRPEDT